MNDEKECTIIHRETPGKEWKLQAHTQRVSVAVRSAAQTQAQEHRLGRTRFEAKAIPRADYEAGRFKVHGLTWAEEPEEEESLADVLARVQRKRLMEILAKREAEND